MWFETLRGRRSTGERALGIALLLACLTATAAPAAAVEPANGEDMGGVYLLADGRIITILSGAHSAEFELDGVWVALRATGEDRWTARDEPHEDLIVHRSAGGEVTGIELSGPEGRITGTRVDMYGVEEVTFEGPGAILSGSLLLPSGPGPHPGVVIVQGAEIGTRETYRLTASHLARRGVAVLIYDKRGLGRSTGRFVDGTFDTLTADALAGLAALGGHPGIDPDRVGMMGFSQGAWLIAQAATASDDVSFVIPVSGSGFTPAAAAAWLSGNLLSLRGLDGPTIDAAARAWSMMYSSLDLVDAGVMPRIPDVPGFWFHRLDPYLDSEALWRRVAQPVLGLWGELDCQVPAVESAQRLFAALRSGGNRNHTLRVFPGGSHALALVPPCTHEMGGMHSHGMRYRFADGFLEAPAAWILSLVAPRETSQLIVPSVATDSPLGWHQEPDRGVPWYGTFLPQMAAFAVLLVALAGLALVRLWAVTLGRRKRDRLVPPAARLLASLGVATGLVGLLLGQGGIAEILTLGDVHADFVWGGPVVDGVPPMLAAASAAATASLTLMAAAAVVLAVARVGTGRRLVAGLRPTLAVGAVFAAWAAYWGMFALRLPIG